MAHWIPRNKCVVTLVRVGIQVWRQKKPLVSHHIFKKGSGFKHGDQNPKTTTENVRQLGISVDGSRRSLSKPSPEKLRTEIDRDGKGKELNKCGRLTSVNTLCEHTAHDKVAQ